MKSFFCDLLVVGVESFRHLPQGSAALAPFVTEGLEPYAGARGTGFGYSALKDAFFVLLDEGCEGQPGLGLEARRGDVLDKDDETGSDLASACQFLEQLHLSLSDVIREARQHSARFLNSDTDLISPLAAEQASEAAAASPVIRSEPESWGAAMDGQVTLFRAPRLAFV